MNWEETILYLRSTAYYKELLRDSYLDEDIVGNVERFRNSEEFLETLRILKEHAGTGKALLDVGAGNGIASIAFALEGYEVTAVEPDPSSTVGTGAISDLKIKYDLASLQVVRTTAEHLPFENQSFDIVYVRQAMHHAADLQIFVKECARVLRPGGTLLTVRDHVIYNHDDKQRFLREHPLHKYYGGENAYKDGEYQSAIKMAGLEIKQVLRFFDSVINYFPMSREAVASLPEKFKKHLKNRAIHKFGLFGRIRPISYIYRTATAIKFGGALDERRIPGRLYSYLATKPVNHLP